MNRITHNPVLRVVMLVLAVFLAWPCAGECEGGQLSGMAYTAWMQAASCPSAASGIAAPDDCGHGCGCPCLSDSVKVRAERPLYVPVLPPATATVMPEPLRPQVIILPDRDDSLPPSPRPVASEHALRAPPLV